MKIPALVIAGSVTLDENIIRGKRLCKIGGVPVYGGLTWKKMGYDPVIVSNISMDRRIRDLFTETGIRAEFGASGQTTTFINAYDGDSRRQRMNAAAPPIHPDQIKAVWNGVRHIHLGPLHPEDISPAVYELEKESRLLTLDIQGLIRSVEGNEVLPKVSPIISRAFEMVDIIKADDTELAMTLRFLNFSVNEVLERFRIREIVETRAGEGGCIHTPEADYAYQAYPKSRILDTTGAGDVFFAAYLCSRIHKHEPVQAACSFAAAIAARHIEGRWIDSIALVQHGRENYD